jgi:PhoH-like protein
VIATRSRGGAQPLARRLAASVRALPYPRKTNRSPRQDLLRLHSNFPQECWLLYPSSEIVVPAKAGASRDRQDHLAVSAAVAALEAEEVGRIVLTRPAVEVGERLGYPTSARSSPLICARSTMRLSSGSAAGASSS